MIGLGKSVCRSTRTLVNPTGQAQLLSAAGTELSVLWDPCGGGDTSSAQPSRLQSRACLSRSAFEHTILLGFLLPVLAEEIRKRREKRKPAQDDGARPANPRGYVKEQYT